MPDHRYTKKIFNIEKNKMTIEEKFTQHCNDINSDIFQHLPTLKRYAEMCETVTEFGVRDVVSTYAFLLGCKKVWSYDIHFNDNIYEAYHLAKDEGKEFLFSEADVLKIEIFETDLLFIDTLHTYTQLKRELALHAGKVKKFILLHDTETYGNNPEPSSWQTDKIMENYVENDKGLSPAIHEFLQANPQWRIREVFTNNNGLTVLERV